MRKDTGVECSEEVQKFPLVKFKIPTKKTECLKLAAKQRRHIQGTSAEKIKDMELNEIARKIQ